MPAGRSIAMRRALLIVGVAALVFGVVPSAGAEGGGGGRFVFPPDAEPLGVAYPEWHGLYQIWENEIPTPENPSVDPSSPKNCALKRRGAVVFLGAFGADCSVPAGIPLVFGTASWECSTAEGLGETFRRLRRCANENFDRDFGREIFYQKVVIDGVHLKRSRRWVSVTPGEIIDFPEDNIWDAEPGPSRSVSKGFLFVLRGMSPGEHEVFVKVLFEGEHVFDVTWTLHVEAAA
jgi:hypothetical protein